MTATAASEAFLQSGSQIVLWRKAVIQSASQPASQPGLFCSVCLISQFTRCFIGSYYGNHGDAIRFNGIFFSGQSNKRKKKPHIHTQTRQRLTKHTPAGEMPLVPPQPLLHSISRNKRNRPTFPLMWNTDSLTLNCPLSFHTSGFDQRASYEQRPLGLLITVLLNSGSDSSQRMSLCLLNTRPLPPISGEQLSLLKRRWQAASKAGDGTLDAQWYRSTGEYLWPIMRFVSS